MNSNLINLSERNEEDRMSSEMLFDETIVTAFLANASKENFFVIKWGR